MPRVGDQLWPGQGVADIPLLDEMEVEVFELEIDANGLKEGQPAEVTIEARPGQVWPGKIRLVENGLNKNVDLKLLAPTMAEHAISMTVDLGVGSSKATVWTCDFSYEYVKINGEYHT